jgi:hypothetical protein
MTDHIGDTNKMVTAVEWLIEQLKEYDCADIKDSQNWVIKIDALVLTAKVEQAKAMEKKQIINAHLEGWSDAYDYLQDNGSKPARQAEEYYNETYNK